MNLLVLGNGFDLLHGLPTTYKDFIDFTTLFRMSLEKNDISRRDYDSRMIDFILHLSPELSNELESLIKDNLWLIHLEKETIGEGWKDFEKEMSEVIQKLDAIRVECDTQFKSGQKVARVNEYLGTSLLDFWGDCCSFSSMEPIKELRDILTHDLLRLTRCLEIYLDAFVNHLDTPKYVEKLQVLNIDKVLSFNYTNTYERLYGDSEVEYDYIHGKANLEHDIETCDLVLGIDEYLTGERKDQDNEYIEFKKFYQRIFKRTGCRYLTWLKQSQEERLNIYIFGHSLDVTDKDILRQLILARHAHTTIFYIHKSDLKNQIKNLVKVIGEDELIERAYGSHITIHFKKV